MFIYRFLSERFHLVLVYYIILKLVDVDEGFMYSEK